MSPGSSVFTPAQPPHVRPLRSECSYLRTAWKTAEDLDCGEVRGTLKFMQLYTSFHSSLKALENKSLMELGV